MKNTNEIMSDLAKDASHIPVLRNILVKNGIATASDLDTFVQMPIHGHLDNGLYHGAAWRHSIFIKNDFDAREEDFPLNELPDAADIWATVTIPIMRYLGDLKWMMKAVCKDETRYYLNGACFNMSDQEIVATDAARLHMISGMEFEIFPQRLPENTGAIIRRQDMDIVIAVAEYLLPFIPARDPRQQTISISFYKGNKWQALISYGTDNKRRVRIAGKLIDGAYPAYKNLWPKDGEWKGEFKYDAAPVIAACKDIDVRGACRMGGWKKRSDHFIRFKDGTAETCALESHHLYRRYDEAKTDFPFTIAFNTRYLADMPHGLCRYTDEKSPVMFSDDYGRAAILMPVAATGGNWGE